MSIISRRPHAPRGSRGATGVRTFLQKEVLRTAGLLFAERAGFEPAILRWEYTGFRDQRLQPLGHLSELP